MKTLSRCLKAIRRHLVTTVVALLVILILTISISGYLFQWDFAGVTASSDQKITINTPNGTITVIQQQPAKTLWDWMSVLVIPVGLIILGAGFQQAQDDKNDKERIKQADIDADEHARQADIDMEERERQAEEVRQAKVQTYVDKIVDFLLHGNLLTALPGSPVRLEAQARTLTLLEQLEGDEDQKKSEIAKKRDAAKKREVIQFLYYQKLIRKDVEGGIINLEGANLQYANLNYMYLPKVNLSGASMQGAYMTEIDLEGADLTGSRLGNATIDGGAFLSGVVLKDADLFGTDLSDAKLIGADLTSVTSLAEANFEGANLTRAKYNEVEIEKAQLKGATLKNGNPHPYFFITETQGA